MRLLREVREGENDIREGQERESRAGQFAEQTVLRDTICGLDGLGLLLDLLKAREPLINCGSSHFSILPENPLQGVEQGGCQPLKPLFH
jgi:hypothetical protein